MIINHNMNAMNAHRNMMSNVRNSGKSMEKLSSGLRINRAGDDAAGLAISEKMRAQVRGLDQASRNAQDGISMIQTAEGALNETHSILQRMRELATQAANDTNNTDDRKQIQKEINQLTSEINRIGNTTEFNTKKMLDGSSGASSSSSSSKKEEDAVLKALKSWWIQGGAKLVKDSYGIEVPENTKIKVVLDEGLGSTAAFVSAKYKQDSTSTTGVTGKGSSLELHINMDAAKPLNLETSKDGGNAPMYDDRVIAHELTHAVMSQTMNFGELETWFKEGTAEFVHGADERLAQSIKSLGSVSAVVSKIGNGAKWPENAGSDEYSAAYLAVRYLDQQLDGEGGIKKIFDFLKESTNQDKTLSDALGATTKYSGKSVSDFITEFKGAITDKSTMETKAGINLNNKDTGSVLGKDNGGANEISAKDVIKETGDLSAVPTGIEKLAGFEVEWPGGEENSSSGMTLQIGANKGQAFKMSIKDMRSEALGISSKTGGTTGAGEGEGSSKDATSAKITGSNSAAPTTNSNSLAVGDKLEITIDGTKYTLTGDAIKTAIGDGTGKGESDLKTLLNNMEDGSSNKLSSVAEVKIDGGKISIISNKEGASSEVKVEILGTGESTIKTLFGFDGTEKAKGEDAKTTDSSNAEGVTGAAFTSDKGVTNGTDSDVVESALDVSSHENATNAIDVLNTAINKVSSERSKLGAYQNRLEHTINNLGTSSENLQAAESRIRDVDMASEMMTFSKNNILGQAAQAMLAQANQQPQGVLQLLR
ncbi:flagellinolysin [Clostridium oceanicum]|uniref:Flagellin n=1 Tax=Clostridium oceanicum TaxID=1543 RepID=A0ABP3V1F4_9CLOT